MFFKDVVGQQNAKRGLLQMWHNNVFPHALLILGAEGTGGLPMGLALAQYILCENKQNGDSCGKCSNCSKASKIEHADLHISFPNFRTDANKGALSKYYHKDFKEFVSQSPYGTTYDWLQHINCVNKQGNLSSDECNDIINILNLKSYEGGKKVQLIWRPEYLRKEGNKLLKLIEEPPADSILILIAESTEDVLPTILSRTQSVRLAPIPASDIADALMRNMVNDPSKAAQIAHLAQGSYTEALRIARSTDNDLYPAVQHLFQNLFKNNGLGIAKFVEDWSKQGREQQKNLLGYLIHLLEHVIRARYMPNMEVTLPEQEWKFVKYVADSKIPFEGLKKMVSIITDTLGNISQNAHSKTQLHSMAIELNMITRKR